MPLQVVGQIASTQRNLNGVYVDRIIKNYPFANFDEGFINRHFASPWKPTLAVKAIASMGNIFDGVSGVLSMAEQFKHDRERGDLNYTETMLQSLSSVAQLSGASAAGVVVGGFFSGAVLPIVIGGAAAVGTGYLIGKGVDWIRESW